MYEQRYALAMHLTHLIIDDFFNDPLKIRQTALSLDYPVPSERQNFPGRNASSRLDFGPVERITSQLTHENLVPRPQTSYGRPRIALEGDTGVCDVHIDFNHWSAIVYLTLDEHAQEGTHLYRHKATGLDRAPAFPGEAEALGYADGRSAVEDILGNDANDLSKWERTMTIPMRFNRMVLFRGYMWHDAGRSFGDSLENGRLIVPFFFDNTRPTG